MSAWFVVSVNIPVKGLPSLVCCLSGVWARPEVLLLEEAVTEEVVAKPETAKPEIAVVKPEIAAAEIAVVKPETASAIETITVKSETTAPAKPVEATVAKLVEATTAPVCALR